MASLTLRHYALVFACFITATFAWGLGFYSFGFYLDALKKVQGWPTGAVAGTVAVHSLITGAAGILVGRWLTHLGPRTVLLGGSLAMAVGSYGIGYLTLLEAKTAVWLVLFPFALAVAGFAVSLAAIAAVAGQLLIGYLSLRINVFRLAMACYLTQGIGIAIAALGTAPWMHYAGVAVAGLVVGAIVMLTPLMINRTFSKESFPIAYGWMAAMKQSTAFLTAITVGWLRDATGDYLVGFKVLAAMHLCAAVVASVRRG